MTETTGPTGTTPTRHEPEHPLHVVVMGVAGSGKTTVARLLADRLGWTFAEADEFHPAANIAKMHAGTPLDDADRWPWLRAIRDWTTAADRDGRSTVVTCSALKVAYRDLLREAQGRLRFVHLDGSAALIGERITARTDHFMPASLLGSQLATLEPLEPRERGIVVAVDAPPAQLVDTILDRLEGLDLTTPDPTTNDLTTDLTTKES